MQLQVHAQAQTRVSLHVQFITREIKVFSLFVLVLLYIFHKEKFFSEEFFIEDYIHEI